MDHAATLKIKDWTIAAREFNTQPVEKFLNKNYYNPNYMYNTEGPEIMRLYNAKDNTEHHTFTDVLDSVYNNVWILLSKWMCPEYYYPMFFCAFLYAFEPEWTIAYPY